MLEIAPLGESDSGMHASYVAALRAAPTHELQTTIYTHAQWPHVQQIWAGLVAASPYASFFLSAEWIEAWLESYGDLLQPRILVFNEQGRAAGACLLVERKIFRGPLSLQCAFLNTAGEDESEETCADFNNLLCLAGREQAVAVALQAYLNLQNPDEICATGFVMGRPLDALALALVGRTRRQRIERSFYVDLRKLRTEACPYLMALRQSTRTNIRRAYKQYGTIKSTAADNIEDALAMFEELVQLHQKTWNARGHSGAFASPRMVGFIRRLIRLALPAGAVLVLRVTSGEQTIGVLLHFIFRGKVSYYAGGFCYRNEPGYSPGIVALVAAIDHCLERGFDEVDFLAGESAYKQRLSTASRNLAWTVFQKPGAKMTLLRMMREFKRWTLRLKGQN